ncbi:g128 [Coccomyxa elongata]
MLRSRSARRGIITRNAFESLVPENTDYDSPEENWQTVEKKQVKNTQQPEASINDSKLERYKDKKNSKTELCTYYPNCARGDNCWFSHDPEVSARAWAGTASGSQNGPPTATASRGSACTYAHGPSELRRLPPKRRGAASQSHSTNNDTANARENGHGNGRNVNKNMAALAVEHGHNINDDEAPDAFCCPITHQDVLRDPVVACDGYSYERDAIKDWLQKHDTSPMTNEKLESKHLIPNLALRVAIRVMYS